MDIVVDWGTSRFRAWRLDSDGAVTARHTSGRGIITVEAGGFGVALEGEIGTWLEAGAGVTCAGMVTSRNGWVETPYVPVPTTLSGLGAGVIRRPAPWGGELRFLPGVAALDADPDVMRGEEIQVFGAVDDGFEGVVVLPGTHAKWVAVAGGAIHDLATFLTGETYGLLMEHSIVGRIVPKDRHEDPGAFAAGLDRGTSLTAAGDLLHEFFAVRARALVGGLEAASVPDFLSGLLLGAEIRAGIARTGAKRVRLVGEPALTARYGRACDKFEIAWDEGPGEPTLAGYRRLRAAGF